MNIKYSNHIYSHLYNMSKNIASVVYDTLVKQNVKDVFLYSGGSIMSLIDKFYDKSDINYYINSNEVNAGMSAVGYAKSSNKTGVVITTSGPSMLSTISAMADATNDSTPLVVISGQVASSAIGTNAFQESPATSISSNITKGSFLLTDSDPFIVRDTINNAFWLANDKKKGSVHIDIPKDILNTAVSDYDYDCVTKSYIKYGQLPDNHIYNLTQLSNIANIINKANMPIIIAGKGCVDAIDQISDLVVNKGLCITTTLHGLGVAPLHTYNLGMCGMHGTYLANQFIQESDCIIAIGSRFDDRITGDIKSYAPHAKNIIHIDIEQKQVNTVMKHRNCKFIIGDAQNVLKQLNPLIKNRYDNDNNNLIYETDNKLKKHNLKYNELIKTKHVHETPNIMTRDLISIIDKYTKNRKDVIFTSGVGNHQMFMAQMLSFNYPKKFITSGSLGDMNAAMGYTIGAQIANPDKLIIGILGDGSFHMGINELNTIKNYNLPVKIFIDNNSSLEMVHCWEKLFYNNRRTATELKNPDFKNIASAYGIKSINLVNKIQMCDNIKYILNYNGPIICNVITKPDYCFPLVLPGNALHQMQLLPSITKNNNINSSILAPS